jgi:flagellar basal body-associated protein FliL
MERIMKIAVVSALVVSLLGLGTAVYAQSAKDDTCNRTAKAELERCQKRLGPAANPVDPKNPTAAEQKAQDKYSKDWKACIDKAEKRGAVCRM